jgi:hypothetical protein
LEVSRLLLRTGASAGSVAPQMVGMSRPRRKHKKDRRGAAYKKRQTDDVAHRGIRARRASKQAKMCHELRKHGPRQNRQNRPGSLVHLPNKNQLEWLLRFPKFCQQLNRLLRVVGLGGKGWLAAAGCMGGARMHCRPPKHHGEPAHPLPAPHPSEKLPAHLQRDWVRQRLERQQLLDCHGRPVFPVRVRVWIKTTLWASPPLASWWQPPPLLRQRLRRRPAVAPPPSRPATPHASDWQLTSRYVSASCCRPAHWCRLTATAAGARPTPPALRTRDD